MAKPHSSLSPRTNVLLIICWALVASVLLFAVPDSARIVLAAAGMIAGAIGGALQHRSFREAAPSFVAASSLMDIRRAMTATKPGRLYIKFLYLSKAVLIVLALTTCGPISINTVFGYLAAYFVHMFVRECVTLRDTFVLAKLSASEPVSEPA